MNKQHGKPPCSLQSIIRDFIYILHPTHKELCTQRNHMTYVIYQQESYSG